MKRNRIEQGGLRNAVKRTVKRIGLSAIAAAAIGYDTNQTANASLNAAAMQRPIIEDEELPHKSYKFERSNFFIVPPAYPINHPTEIAPFQITAANAWEGMRVIQPDSPSILTGERGHQHTFKHLILMDVYDAFTLSANMRVKLDSGVRCREMQGSLIISNGAGNDDSGISRLYIGYREQAWQLALLHRNHITPIASIKDPPNTSAREAQLEFQLGFSKQGTLLTFDTLSGISSPVRLEFEKSFFQNKSQVLVTQHAAFGSYNVLNDLSLLSSKQVK